MNTRKFSSEQEKRISKFLGAKVVANSGATMFNKGDIRLDNTLLIECKTCTTEKDSFTIRREWLIKNKQEAFSQGITNGALCIDFGRKEDYFIIDSKLMLILVNVLKEVNDEK